LDGFRQPIVAECIQPTIATVHARFTAVWYRPGMVAHRLALVALMSVLVAPLWFGVAGAEPRMRCLSRDQQRAAIQERHALPLATVRRAVRGRVPGELLRAQLCQEPQRLIYLLTVLARDGKVRRVMVEAKNGAVVSVR
jgi:hypothetical protein